MNKTLMRIFAGFDLNTVYMPIQKSHIADISAAMSGKNVSVCIS